MASNYKGGPIPAAVLLILFAVAAFSAACGSSGAQGNRGPGGNANAEAAEPPVPVTTARTESREVPAVIQTTGSLVADETSNVAPKVAGKVVNVGINVGDFVGQGAVIAKIDDSDPRRRLAAAEAGVKQAVAGVRQAEARLGLSPNGTFNASTIPEVRSANANYQQALAELRQAEANEERYRDLVRTGDTAMITYEQYRTARD